MTIPEQERTIPTDVGTITQLERALVECQRERDAARDERKQLIDMIWKVRKAWMYRVIMNAEDLNSWLSEMTVDERALSSEFLDFMHEITNPHLKNGGAQ